MRIKKVLLLEFLRKNLETKNLNKFITGNSFFFFFPTFSSSSFSCHFSPMFLDQFLNEANSAMIDRLFIFTPFATIQQVLKIDRLKQKWINRVAPQHVESVNIELSTIDQVTTDDFYLRINHLSVKDSFRMLLNSKQSPILQKIFCQVKNLSVLDVSDNRTITDSDMQTVFNCAPNLHIVTFPGCPLLTSKTLDIVATKSNILILASTIPLISFPTLFKILEGNPKVSMYIPQHTYNRTPITQICRTRYPDAKINSVGSFYGMINSITEEKLAAFDKLQLNKVTVLPCLSQSTQEVNGKSELDITEPLELSTLVANNACMLTMTILDDRFDKFSILLNHYDQDMLKYVLHALELGKIKVYKNLYKFIKLIFENCRKIAIKFNLDFQNTLKTILNMYQLFIADNIFKPTKSEKTDLCHLFLDDENLLLVMNQFDIDFQENGRMCGVILGCLINHKYEILKSLLKQVDLRMIDISNLLKDVFAYDFRTFDALEIIDKIFCQSSFMFAYTDEKSNSWLHLMMFNKLLCDVKTVTPRVIKFMEQIFAKIVNRLEKKFPGIYVAKNQNGFTPMQIGLFMGNTFLLEVVRNIGVNILPCDLFTLQNVCKSGNMASIELCITQHLKKYQKPAMTGVEFIELNEEEECVEADCCFLFLHYPKVLKLFLDMKPMVNNILIKKNGVVKKLSVLEYAVLYKFPEEVVDILVESMLTMQSYGVLDDVDRINEFQVFQNLKIKVLRCDFMFLLLEYPTLFEKFMKTYDSESEILLVRNDKEIKYTLLEFLMVFRFPLQTIVNCETSKVEKFIFHKWLDIYFNMFLKPVPGLDSFADIDLETMNYKHDPLLKLTPLLDGKMITDMKMFLSVLNNVDVRLLCEKHLETEHLTPIPFFLVHLRLIYSPASLIVEKVLGTKDYELNQTDKLGNTIMHVLAREQITHDLYQISLKHLKSDIKILNLRNESSFLVYVKSLNIAQFRGFKLIVNHGSIRVGNLIEYDLLFQFDNTFRNAFTVSVVRDEMSLINGMSLLTENIIHLSSKISEKESIHGFFHHWPLMYITNEDGIDSRQKWTFEQWTSLLKRLKTLDVNLNAVEDNKTILDIISSRKELEGERKDVEDILMVLKDFGCKSNKEINPEVIVKVKTDSTILHQKCMNPSSIIYGILKSHPELIYASDKNDRFPIHLFVISSKARGIEARDYLVALLGYDEQAADICRKADCWLMTTFMASILGDVLNGVNIDDDISFISKYIRELRQNVIPEDSQQRNAVFMLIKNISGFTRDFVDLQNSRLELCPESVLMLVRGFIKYCGLNLEDVDENDCTIMDVWGDVISEKSIPFAIQAKLETGMKRLGAKTADELFGDSTSEEETEDLQKGSIYRKSEEVLLGPNYRSLVTDKVEKVKVENNDKLVLKGLIEIEKKNFKGIEI
jgi:hypothetical protein